MAEYPAWLLNSAIIGEVKKWHSENLIDASLYETLIARYPSSSAKEKIITVLSIIGAVMIGLGSLLFIAAHWTQISVFGKLALIFLSVTVCHFIGWWFQFKKGNQPKLGAAFFLLGCFFYGSGIWLISQIFNLSGDLAQGVLLWSIGTVAMTLATGSTALAVLSVILIGAWTITNTNSPWLSANANLDTSQIFQSLLGMFISLGISYRLRSPWSLALSLVSIVIWFITCSELHEYGLVILGITFFNGYLAHREKWQSMSNPFKYIGVCITFISLLLLTYDKSAKLDFSPINFTLITLITTVCLTAAFIAYKRNKALKTEIICSVLGGSLPFFLVHISNDFWRLLAINVLFLTLVIGLLCIAIDKLRSAWLVNASIVFLAIYMLCRYFDTFFSIMDRSLFFVIGGVLLMLIGAIVERKRRQLLEGIKS